MTYTEVSSGDLIKASVSNANWRHFGRADFSSFYPMDVDGAYASQDLGETSKEWAAGYFTDDVNTDSDFVGGGGVSTDGKEVIKMDVVSGSYSYNSSGAQTINVAHGKSSNVRGATVGYFSSTFNPNGSVVLVVDSTNVIIRLGNTSGSASGTVYFTVFYV